MSRRLAFRMEWLKRVRYIYPDNRKFISKHVQVAKFKWEVKKVINVNYGKTREVVNWIKIPIPQNKRRKLVDVTDLFASMMHLLENSQVPLLKECIDILEETDLHKIGDEMAKVVHEFCPNPYYFNVYNTDEYEDLLYLLFEIRTYKEAKALKNKIYKVF